MAAILENNPHSNPHRPPGVRVVVVKKNYRSVCSSSEKVPNATIKRITKIKYPSLNRQSKENSTRFILPYTLTKDKLIYLLLFLNLKQTIN